MLMVTITLRDSNGRERELRSVAFMRISRPTDNSTGYDVFAIERAEPRIHKPARMAACSVPCAGCETVMSLLGRACGALAAADWAEL